MKRLAMSVGYAKVTRVENRRGVFLNAQFRTQKVQVPWNSLQDYLQNFETGAELAYSRFMERECCYETSSDAPAIQGWITALPGTVADEMLFVPILEGHLPA